MLFASKSHLSAQEICQKIYETYKNEISMTSIYTFLNFLEEHHLANSFEQNGVKNYELNLKSSHDHLICEICGKVVDFEDEMIEQRQDQICSQRSFSAESHKMILLWNLSAIVKLKNEIWFYHFILLFDNERQKNFRFV